MVCYNCSGLHLAASRNHLFIHHPTKQDCFPCNPLDMRERVDEHAKHDIRIRESGCRNQDSVIRIQESECFNGVANKPSTDGCTA